jgi:glutathione peroxidase
MKKALFIMGIVSFLTSCFVGRSRKVEPVRADAPMSSIYDIKLKSLDGKSRIKLSDYKGKYIVIVNTASECGYTYQYGDLQKFYAKYKDSNIVVLGCPCNQFGGQEPGNEVEIEKFCKEKYDVSFPMTEKIEVKGENQHPLYSWLTQKQKNGVGDFEVKWNFNKFVISPEGRLVHYFGSLIKPGDSIFLASVNK